MPNNFSPNLQSPHTVISPLKAQYYCSNQLFHLSEFPWKCHLQLYDEHEIPVPFYRQRYVIVIPLIKEPGINRTSLCYHLLMYLYLSYPDQSIL